MRRIRTKIVIISLVVVSIGAMLVFFCPRPEKSPVELPVRGASYKSLSPGISTKREVIAVLGKPLNDDSSSLLRFNSSNPNLPMEISFVDDKVVFIKEIVTTKDGKTADDITSQYGTAPHFLYGPASVNGFNLYVYPDKGIAYVGHVAEPVILEVWYFQPISLEEFQRRWAPNYSKTHRPIQ